MDGLFQFAAVINLNLAAIYLLLLPALDGGSLALLLVEAARGGSKIPREVEQRIMFSGILVVLGIGLFLIGTTEEKLLQHAYGLGYPEPNVTFALCRGSWSSPVLRVYTAHNIVNKLESAKVEYLEASIGITSKKKIVMPKLLHWHMRDFADVVESLREWIYSQLPGTGSLKRSIMECLIGETKMPLTKMVEIQPYEAEFRYMLPF